MIRHRQLLSLFRRHLEGDVGPLDRSIWAGQFLDIATNGDDADIRCDDLGARTLVTSSGRAHPIQTALAAASFASPPPIFPNA